MSSLEGQVQDGPADGASHRRLRLHRVGLEGVLVGRTLEWGLQRPAGRCHASCSCGSAGGYTCWPGTYDSEDRTSPSRADIQNVNLSSSRYSRISEPSGISPGSTAKYSPSPTSPLIVSLRKP